MAQITPNSQKPEKEPENQANFENIQREAVSLLSKISVFIWNVLMGIAIKLGLMRYFISYQLLFPALCLLTLATLPPFGACLIVLAIYANQMGAKPEDNFIVKL